MSIVTPPGDGAAPAVPPATRPLTDDDFAVPLDDRFFEDYVTGSIYEYGHVTVSEAEILEFAERYDPQPIHIAPEYATTGPFGGLIASGWHTGAICMRLLVDHYISRVASLASPGMDELRWPAPLRPGDTVRLRAEVGQTRRSRSRPDRGIVHTHATLIAGDRETGRDKTVLTLTALNFIRCRRAG